MKLTIREHIAAIHFIVASTGIVYVAVTENLNILALSLVVALFGLFWLYAQIYRDTESEDDIRTNF